MATHGEPVRRQADHVQVHEQTLHDGRLVDASSLLAVGFRVGQCGRFEWQSNGTPMYLQYFPPSLQTMESPAEFILQQMARAGVDRAVLQNARPYGRLNEYFADAIETYPNKFIGLADVDEAHAHTPAEIARLRRAICEQGLRGVYYANRALFSIGYTHAFDDPVFDPYWEEVRGLGVPVFWEIFGAPLASDEAQLLAEIERFNRWTKRWPDIPGVWTHGLTPELLDRMPEPLEQLLHNEHVLIEILYPIYWGRVHAYPYPELRPALQTLHRYVGGERLVWGSDMPNVERNCTYNQSLTYLVAVAEGWLPGPDLDKILGLNVLRLLGV
jgi:predicted TIM-barrel fold metal-dependent hydrolase